MQIYGGHGARIGNGKDGESEAYQLSVRRSQAAVAGGRETAQRASVTLHINGGPGTDQLHQLKGPANIFWTNDHVTNRQPVTFVGAAETPEDGKLHFDYKVKTMYGEPVEKDVTGGFDVVIHETQTPATDVAGQIKAYVQGLAQYEEQTRARPVAGTLTLRDPDTGMVAEQKPFSIVSMDAIAIIKNAESLTFSKFNTQTINLINPTYTIDTLDGLETITAFSNIDPVSVFDLVLNFILNAGSASILSLLGIDEINVGGWVFSIAEYAALMSNAVYAPGNSFSQNVEYFTNLRENWTQRDLLLYLNNRSDGFQYIQPVHPINDICVVIPTSPPDIFIG